MSEETKTFDIEDILETVNVVNMFTQNINDASKIMLLLVAKHESGRLKLDDDTLDSIVAWFKDYTLTKERLTLLNEGKKPN